GAGKRPSDVAKELGFEQRFGNRAAVQGDEAMQAPRTVMVNRPSDDLLPRPGLAGDENRAAGRRHGFQQLDQGGIRAALTHQALESVLFLELRSEIGVLRLQTPLLERRIEDVEQLINLKRLADEIPRAAFDRFNGVF